VTAVPKNQPAYYFRKKFLVPQTRYEEFLLSATCTDDYGGVVYPMRIWLNGTEVMSGGIEAVSGEGNVVKYFDLAPFLDLIHQGTNTIAVMLNNTWQADWDNVAFDISLKGIPAVPLPGSAKLSSIKATADGSIVMRAEGTPGSRWSLLKANSPSGSRWSIVQEINIEAEGVSTVSLAPSSFSNSATYFRLVQVP
jgi:hypothetical protein